ncbi:MAG: sigma-70 family RNA polymerase sigma factor [Acidimicrobiales bacterium]
MNLPPFQAVLDEHAGPVHRYLMAAVGYNDAGDCFQETMLAALRAYPTLRHDHNLGGWLFTIAHRKVIDQARSRTRRAIPVGDVPERRVGDGEPTMPDGALWAAVDGLPPKQRTAVLLRHAADRPYAEIATVLDCTEAAARQNVRAGLARLRLEVAA